MALDRRAIAVLPIVNATGDSANAYIADGMTAELTGALTRVPGLRIISRSAAATVDTRKPIVATSVGPRLGAGALLGGRLVREESKLRLSLQIVETANGSLLWSGTYDGDVRNAFTGQDSGAHATADGLHLGPPLPPRSPSTR